MGLCVAKNLPLRGELLCLVSLVWKAAFQTGLVTGCLMALMVLSSVVKVKFFGDVLRSRSCGAFGKKGI